MKLTRHFKTIFFATLAALYFSGVVTWFFETWVHSNEGFGIGPHPATPYFLRLHSIVSLFFLILFGYLFHSHIEPGLRVKQKTRSGLTLLGLIVLVIATVPGLFYLTSETWRQITSHVHVYVGLLLPAPFFLHFLIKISLKRRKTSLRRRD